MNGQPSTISNSSAWETLAQVYAGSRQVSADKLIEWPAQKGLVGDVRGKRVLDVGCGTGDKARFLAEQGASSVIGVDASGGFATNWAEHANCSNLQLVQGSFDTLTSLPKPVHLYSDRDVYRIGKHALSGKLSHAFGACDTGLDLSTPSPSRRDLFRSDKRRLLQCLRSGWEALHLHHSIVPESQS